MKKQSINLYYNSYLEKLNKIEKKSFLNSKLIDKRWILFDNQNKPIKTIKFSDSGEFFIIMDDSFTIHKWSEDVKPFINIEIDNKLIECLLIHNDENILIFKLKNDFELIIFISEGYYYKYIHNIDDKIAKLDNLFTYLYDAYLESSLEKWVKSVIDLNINSKQRVGILQGKNFVEAVFAEYYEAKRYLSQNTACKAHLIEVGSLYFPFFIISNNDNIFYYASDFQEIKNAIINMNRYNKFIKDNNGFVGKIYCVLKPIRPNKVNESILETLSYYKLRFDEVIDLFFENYSDSSSFTRGGPLASFTLFSID